MPASIETNPTADTEALSSRRTFLQSGTALATLSATGLLTPACRKRSDPEAGPGADEAATSSGSELAGLDGTALADMLRTKEISATELLEDVLARVERVNPEINAVLLDLFDPEVAVAHAAAFDRGEGGTGHLAGVPVMLKNLTAYKDARIDHGSRLISRAIAEHGPQVTENSPLVDAMERSGMIIAGITSSPEFGLIDTTEPVLHGPTRNPWNLNRTAGGSSGGSGAAVAAGIVPLGHGDDGGGSIRLPASQCGVFGLKPTRGRELGSQTGVLAIANALCLSRSVRDTAAFLDHVEVKDRSELPPVGFVARSEQPALRIGLMKEALHGRPAHREVQNAMTHTAALCEQLGHTVTEIALPIDGTEFIDAFIGLWAASTVPFAQLAEEMLGPEIQLEDVLEPWTLGLMAMGNERGPEACSERATSVFIKARVAFDALFSEYDVILQPVLLEPPYEIGWHDPAGDFEVIYERVLNDVSFTPLHNALGTPAMSVPIHWTADGLPVGSQFAAQRGGEATLLQLAYALEEATEWAKRRPPVFA